MVKGNEVSLKSDCELCRFVVFSPIHLLSSLPPVFPLLPHYLLAGLKWCRNQDCCSCVAKNRRGGPWRYRSYNHPFSLGVACQFLLFDFAQVDISQCIGMLSYCKLHTDGKLHDRKERCSCCHRLMLRTPVFVCYCPFEWSLAFPKCPTR